MQYVATCENPVDIHVSVSVCTEFSTVFMANEVINFNVSELRDWLENKDDITEDILDVLQTNRVNGRTLVELTENDLKEFFPILGDRKALQRIVTSLKPKAQIVRVSVILTNREGLVYVYYSTVTCMYIYHTSICHNILECLIST